MLEVIGSAEWFSAANNGVLAHVVPRPGVVEQNISDFARCHVAFDTGLHSPCDVHRGFAGRHAFDNLAAHPDAHAVINEFTALQPRPGLCLGEAGDATGYAEFRHLNVLGIQEMKDYRCCRCEHSGGRGQRGN